MNAVATLLPYWAVASLLVIGLYITIAAGNLVKKLIGLGIFQVSVFVFYIAIGETLGAGPPILDARFTRYVNPLPSVLILTAIVVAVATLALGLALAVRIREAFGTVDEAELAPLTDSTLPPSPDAGSQP